MVCEVSLRAGLSRARYRLCGYIVWYATLSGWGYAVAGKQTGGARYLRDMVWTRRGV